MLFHSKKKVKNQQKQITKNWLCILRARPQKGQQSEIEGGTRRNGHENQNQFEANVHSDSASSLLAASADGTARLMEKRTEREWHDTHLWLLLGMKLEKFYNYWVRSLSGRLTRR